MTMVKFLDFVLLLCVSTTLVFAERKDIHHMMYETYRSAAMCFRILNGTHQFGCSTSRTGSAGVIHLVNTEADVTWLVESSKAGPYVAVVPPHMFVREVMLRLRTSPRVSGVMVAINQTAGRPRSMSPDDTCPNHYSSLSGSCSDASPWNPFGSGFLQDDWPISLFVVKDPSVLQQVHDCFVKFNLPLDGQEERPLCSLQMFGHMYAAVDTPTCLRRNSLVNSFNPLVYCDQMGDQNIISQLFLRKLYAAAPNNSVVLVTARLDVAAMFDGLAPGAMTTVSGIVTLLTTASLLSQLLPVHKPTYTKNVVFALLNGEAQDYIGSSRVVYDMQHGKFPSSDLPLRLEHLDQIIDLHQLDYNNHVQCHCFQSATAQKTVELLVNSSKQFHVTVDGSCSHDTLPPSSLHSFLKANTSIPGIILTNHAASYTNSYYNGLLDDSVNLQFQYANGSQVPAASIQTSLAQISQTLALSLAQLVDSTVSWPSNLTLATIAQSVDELLYCYLESRQCKAFHSVIGDGVVGEGPLPLYVGVSRSSNQITTLTFLTLAKMTGRPTNATKDQCDNPRDPAKEDGYTYVWVTDDTTGTCMETGLTITPAVSPAFLIDDYNWTSGEYPSWTESVWPELSLRMFLRPPFSQELGTLVTGLAVLFLSFVCVYWVNRNSDQLFSPLMCDRC